RLTRLRNLEMNFNEVGSLNLSGNVALELLRYQSSAQADATQRLNRIDLASNSSLRHLSLPGHDLVAIDLRANTSLDDTLDLSENPGPDGDRMTPDIVVPAPIFDQIPAENRMGVISDAEAPVQLSLTADVMSLPESGGAALLTAILNRTSTVSVTLTLVTDGTATLGVDYELSAMTLSIAAGESTAQATVTARDDMDMEGLETIVITATEVAGAQAGTIVVDLNLTDDDGVLPLVINEVLYDPPNDMPGDANGDGAREANEDEFVEIVNISASPVDLSGFMFFDTAALDMGMPRHTVPAGTMLGANQAYVLFGGGTPTGSFGGALVEAANGFEGRINLNNAGDVLTVQNSAGATILTFDVEPLSNNPNESYTRAPDLTGEFEQHNGVADGVLYSPGTRADGSNF
ncbi:MAG: lamin tail domain-containing protein, partial [Myxococcota bacterium]